MHVASPELRDRIADLLEQAPEPYGAASPLRNRVQQILAFNQRTAAPRFAFYGMRALAFVAAMLLFAGFWFFQMRPATPTPSEFAMMAVDSHSRRIRNQLPLEIKTSSLREAPDPRFPPGIGKLVD